MADVKISGLPASTVPLAGTEVLPIVQSGVTKQVANNDLRPKQIQSNATSGVLQVAGPGAAATRVMTTPDANFTAARTDAAQSFTGDQTLSTGNVVIGTSGQGIDFSATPGTGTSELLNDYEEGTFTPGLMFGAGTTGITYAPGTTGKYTKIGNMVFVSGAVILTNKGSSTGQAQVTGFPFNVASGADTTCVVSLSGVTFADVLNGKLFGTANKIFLYEITNAGVSTDITNADFANASDVYFNASYIAA